MSDALDLARRAVACKGWRWMPGMLVVASSGRATSAHRVTHDSWSAWGGELPDLTDPATIGCLLALVREAWGDDGITTSCTRCGGGTGWSVHRSSPVDGVSALVPILSESEATVLVCALEAAPC